MVRWVAVNNHFVRTGHGRQRFVVVRLSVCWQVGRNDRIAFTGFVNLHRFAVEVRIGEMVGCAAKVDECEVILAGVFMHAGATADDLFELGQAADATLQHNETTGLRVNASGEQARGGDDNRRRTFGVDEIAELVFALGIVAGDAHDVARIFVHQVGVFVDQRLPHPRRVGRVFAEDDGLLHAVATGLEIVTYPFGNARGAVVDDERAVEVFLVVETVFDQIAKLVNLAGHRAVAFDVNVEMYLDDFVGREKAVANALLEAVGVDRRAEVVAVRNVFGFLGRCGHADLGGCAEVREDFAPRGIVRCAAAMTLINDDQIKESRAEFFEQFLSLFRAGDGLIKPEINLVSGVDATLVVGAFFEREGEINIGAVGPFDSFGVGAELCHRAAKRAKVVDHCLVNQNIAVGQKQDALFLPSLP